MADGALREALDAAALYILASPAVSGPVQEEDRRQVIELLDRALAAADAAPERRARTWTCRVTGPDGPLPGGADLPMRQAVREAYQRVTGVEPSDIWSGWGDFDTSQYGKADAAQALEELAAQVRRLRVGAKATLDSVRDLEGKSGG